MQEFSEVIDFLNDEHPPIKELTQKYQNVNRLRQKLRSLTDLQRIEETYNAVEKRMGPMMCDNTVIRSRQDKKDFLIVLKNYQNNIDRIKRNQQYVHRQLKTELRVEMRKIEQKKEQFEEEMEKQIVKLREQVDAFKLEINKQIEEIQEGKGWNKLTADISSLNSEISLQMIECQLEFERQIAKLNTLLLKQC